MSIPSSGSSTCRRASMTSSRDGTEASLATGAAPLRRRLRRGRLEVRAETRVVGERRAAELHDHELHLVELDLVASRRRRALPLEQLVAGAGSDEEEVPGGIPRAILTRSGHRRLE